MSPFFIYLVKDIKDDKNKSNNHQEAGILVEAFMLNEDAGFELEYHQQDKDPKNRFMLFAF